MSVTIAGIEFEHHVYDGRADVLYLTVAGYESPPADADATPEGHGIEYDEKRKVIAMTLMDVKWLLDRDGELTITWPSGHVNADELAAALIEEGDRVIAEMEGREPEPRGGDDVLIPIQAL
jgi:uncharacterized protein YuzE